MSDYVFFRKSRNILSSILHIALNILLGAGAIFITVTTKSLLIGFILVLISKWRVFAVQPRYLWLNIKSNLVDFIVGISLVFIAYYYCINSTSALFLYIVLGAFYSIWLTLIKPLSSETGTLIQAITAVFLGITAFTLLSSSLNSIIIILGSFIVGYSASRHILTQNDSKDFLLITLICGLVFSEIAWLCRSWIITYNFAILNSLFIIPQISVILSILIFAFYHVSQSLTKHDGVLKFKDIRTPIFFSIAIIAILLIFFSAPAFNLL